jgi:hypothetical protein
MLFQIHGVPALNYGCHILELCENRLLESQIARLVVNCLLPKVSSLLSLWRATIRIMKIDILLRVSTYRVSRHEI